MHCGGGDAESGVPGRVLATVSSGEWVEAKPGLRGGLQCGDRFSQPYALTSQDFKTAVDNGIDNHSHLCFTNPSGILAYWYSSHVYMHLRTSHGQAD